MASFLYEVRLPGSPGVVHVFASSSDLTPEHRRLDHAVVAVVEASDRVALETTRAAKDEPGVADLLAELTSRGSGPLRQWLTPADASALEAATTRCGSGSLLDAPIQPWFAGVMVYVECIEAKGWTGSSPSELVEELALARPDPPTLVVLGDLPAFFHSWASWGTDPAPLRELLALLASEYVDGHREAWLAGDEARLAALCRTEQARNIKSLGEPFWERTIGQPIVGFADQAVGWLKEGGRTVIALHSEQVLGERGLLSLLRAAGATVRSVPALGLGDPVPELPEPFEPPAFTADFGGEVTTEVQQVGPGAGGISVTQVMHSRLVGGGGVLLMVGDADQLPAEESGGDSRGPDFREGFAAGVFRGLAGVGGEFEDAPMHGVPGLLRYAPDGENWIALHVFFRDNWTFTLMAVSANGDPAQVAEVRDAFEGVRATFQFVEDSP